MATRLKAKAKTIESIPQSKNDCAESIRAVGDLQRDFERRRAEMNDAIAAITQQYQPGLEELSGRISSMQEGIQVWCESHRVELCGENDKNGKTANFVTGTVSWKKRPPSISVRGVETVIEALKRMGLRRFVRSKEEVNKEAMLLEPKAVLGIAGIKVVSDLEDFIVTPFEAKAEV